MDTKKISDLVRKTFFLCQFFTATITLQNVLICKLGLGGFKDLFSGQNRRTTLFALECQHGVKRRQHSSFKLDGV